MKVALYAGVYTDKCEICRKNPASGHAHEFRGKDPMMAGDALARGGTVSFSERRARRYAPTYAGAIFRAHCI